MADERRRPSTPAALVKRYAAAGRSADLVELALAGGLDGLVTLREYHPDGDRHHTDDSADVTVEDAAAFDAMCLKARDQDVPDSEFVEGMRDLAEDRRRRRHQPPPSSKPARPRSARRPPARVGRSRGRERRSPCSTRAGPDDSDSPGDAPPPWLPGHGDVEELSQVVVTHHHPGDERLLEAF